MSLNRRQLGQYELQQRIASDALGEVWTAFDTQLRRYVFIHIVAFSEEAAPTLLPRFLNEAQALVSLHHPNMLQALGVYTAETTGSTPEEAYIVLEYVEGQSLADYIHATAQAGHFPSPATLVQLFMPIASALDYAHQQGIVHGNLKPTSILLNKHNTTHFSEGEPELIGFGTSSLPRPLTPPLDDALYMAPEVAQGRSATARSDLYALGVILYELCTGTLPFQGETPADVMMQHMRAVPTAPALINPHILPALTAVIMRSLSKDPAARFPTASALVVAIARAFNIPAPDSISLSGNWMGTGPNPLALAQSGPAIDHGEATYLTPQSPYVSPAAGQPSPAAISGPAVPRTIYSSPATTPSFSPATPFYSGSGATPALKAQTPAGPDLAALRTQVALPEAAPPTRPTPPRRRAFSRWYLALVALVIIALVVGGVATLFPNLRNGFIPQTTVVGHAFFASSGILNLNSSQGIADRLQVDLQNLPDPQPGKSYYVWLLADNDSEVGLVPILLGTITKGGRTDITYPGDAQHSDLLANYSRLLITEENAGITPSNPSLDQSTWRYYAAFSQVPNPLDTVDHFSLLDHLRHLLAQDPKLKAAGLTGGLDIWLYRNTLKILEWAGSARDGVEQNNVQLARRQLVRILDYLDGSQYIKTENLPPDLQPILVDPTIARVALLEIDPQNQSPPGYLKHIGNHLREITESPGVTPEQKALAVSINQDIDNVTGWLEAVHNDAAQLIHMTPAQLQQPAARAIFDHLFTEANYAFVGQTDPTTQQVKEGVVQIHYSIERLATFNIAPCSSSNKCSA